MSRPANPYAPREVAVAAVAGRPTQRRRAGGSSRSASSGSSRTAGGRGLPLRRHYLELVLAGGRCSVVFCDLETGRWYEQR